MSVVGKWIWICASIDFNNLKSSTIYINGYKFEGVPKGEKDNPKPPPNPYKVRLGKYDVDGRPTLGTFLDVNAWDRKLTDEEAQMYSDCSKANLATGNLVNSTTMWNMNSSLIAVVGEDLKETQCKEDQKMFDLFLPGLWRSF